MRNELIGYLSIPVIVAGGMSVWKSLNPDLGILPGLPSLKWSGDSDREDYTKDEMASRDPEIADEMEESDDDGDDAKPFAPGD